MLKRYHLCFPELSCQLCGSLFLLMFNLISPEPILVESCEAIDNNRDGQGEDENTRKSTESTNHLAHESLGMKIISYCADCHEAPPEGIHKCP